MAEKAGNAWVAKVACGRSREEQTRDIENCGNHGAIPVLRAMALAASGVGKARDTAANALLFGCYRPFSTPYIVRDVIRLLDLLDVEYTWLDKEYCCGLPLLHQAAGEERQAVVGAIQGFMRGNWELAEAKGAKQLVYCCAGCAHAAKGIQEDRREGNKYILDLLLDALSTRALAVTPMRVAYFGGCHTSYAGQLPQVALDWERYRAFLEKVDKLRVVDLPRTLCCKVKSDRIVEMALEEGVDAMVCACSGCNVAIRQAGSGRIRVMSYPELLLESLGVKSDGAS
ncbi:(Fe-S)-binding protein [Desulfovibrio sp. JY]|nr:(Fe-S)-binding protein [Desulfovibrio sp. JY]